LQGIDRVVEGRGLLRVRIVGEFLREHVLDELLHIRRERRVGLADDAVVDVDLLPGLIDHRDRLQRGLVEQDVGARGAVRLDQHLEAGIRRAGLAGNGEVDLHQHGGAADAHGRHRRIDLHVAVLGGLAGDEADGAGHEAHQRGIVRPVGVVDHFVEHHARVRRQAEHRAVDEGDAERRVRAGLHDVALLDIVAIVQNDRDAVADRGRAALQLGDMADDLPDHRTGAGLADLDMPGERVDDVAGQMRAVGRGQRGALLALEIIVEHDFAVIAGQDQVNAGPLEVRVEQEMRVGNDDRIRWRMGRRMIHVKIRVRWRGRAIMGKRGVELASVIQRPPKMVNNYIIIKLLTLHITGA